MSDYLLSAMAAVFYPVAFIALGLSFIVAGLSLISHIWTLYEFLFVIVLLSMGLVVLIESLAYERGWG